MNKSVVLKQLKEALEEEPELLKLRHENPKRNMWLYKVDSILKEGFGPNSDELKLFMEGVPRDELKGSDRQLQKWLDSRIMRRATIIRSIIEKHERQKEMVEPETLEFYRELQEWFEKLKSFKEQLYGKKASHNELEELRSSLLRSAPRFKGRVVGLTGKQYGEQGGRTFDIWDEALSTGVYNGWNWSNRFSLNALVDCTNEALGVLESGEYPKATAESQVLKSSRFSVYEATSPIYWIVRLRRPLAASFRWIKARGLATRVAFIVGFVAAVLTILGFFGLGYFR